ncbi:hypothetical protein ACS0TY_009696 [Phlomoides rotata]
MDVVGKDTDVEAQKGRDDPVNYHAPNMSSDWQINGSNNNNLTNTAANGMIPVVESSAPMVDSFCWDQAMSGQNLGYCDVNAQNAMLRGGGGMFLSPVSGMLPQNLPHFPADSAFIERAARFSCFGGGSFGEMLNPFSVPDPRSLGMMFQGPHEVLGANRHELNITEISNHGTEGRNEKRSESLHDDAKQQVGVSGNESDEAEFSGRGAPDELDSSSGKGVGMKKRKRGGQDTQNDENNEAPTACIETGKETLEIVQKSDQNPSSISKPGGKNAKQGGSQGSDAPKEDYIHVRARRGQATNSHSLAERVRREKISERMKFLQDLVPGCSKVTGKAVMLDEIINYVQSLQRQVEFLSMKLATVNPRLDFNIEGVLAKDMLQPRPGMASLSLLPEMAMHFPAFHPPQPGLIQACLPGTSAEALRRPINLQSPIALGFKEHTSQVKFIYYSTYSFHLKDILHYDFLNYV